MNRPLRADTMRSGDVSRALALFAIVGAIVGLGYWAFATPRSRHKVQNTKPVESSASPEPKSSEVTRNGMLPLV